MKTHQGKLFPFPNYFLIIWSLLFFIGCNPSPELPPAIEGILSLKNVNTINPITANATSEIDLQIENTGFQDAVIGELTITEGMDNFIINGGSCGISILNLAPGEICNIILEFHPSIEGKYGLGLALAYQSAGQSALGTQTAIKKLTVNLQFDVISDIPAPAPIPTPVPTPLPTPVPTPTDGRLHVEGRYIKNANGEVVVLMGVNIADPEHLNLKPWERPNVTAMSVTKNAVENFHAKVIRLPIHPGSPSYPNEGWFGVNGGEKYLNDHVVPLVNYLTSLKIYTIIDLHYVEDWSGKFPKVAAFWNIVAPKFKDNPYVIYEIFNEPIYPDDWNRWKSEIAQPAVNLVRGHAPENLIIVGGPLWSAHMAGALSNPIVGKNIVYTAHIYSNQWPNAISKNFGQAIEQLPFFVTEWGFETGGTEGGSRSAYGAPFAQWMADHQFSWTAWCFDTKWGPRMFDSNWNLLTGEGGMGTFVQDLLLQNQQNNY